MELDNVVKSLKDTLSKRIMLLDGAYGTAIQQYELSEEDFRGGILAGTQNLS